MKKGKTTIKGSNAKMATLAICGIVNIIFIWTFCSATVTVAEDVAVTHEVQEEQVPFSMEEHRVRCRKATTLGREHLLSKPHTVQGWPDKVIRYYIDKDRLTDPYVVEEVINVFDAIAETTCLDFIRLDGPESYNVQVKVLLVTSTTNGRYPTSTLGYNEIANIIRLRNDSQIWTIYHMVLHALGLTHENQRPDAELLVDMDNIQEEFKCNFEKLPASCFLYPVDKFIFEVSSIMSYRPYSACKDCSKRTIDYGREKEGQREPTSIDYMKLEYIYCGLNPPPKETQWYLSFLHRYHNHSKPEDLTVTIKSNGITSYVNFGGMASPLGDHVKPE